MSIAGTGTGSGFGLICKIHTGRAQGGPGHRESLAMGLTSGTAEDNIALGYNRACLYFSFPFR